MKKLPPIRFNAAPDWQKERLGRWLIEWRIDRAIEKSHKKRGTKTGISESALASGQEGEHRAALQKCLADIEGERAAAPGQIRMMAPLLTAESFCPLYIAVLRQWDADQMLVAPFGRFAEPATTGELLTGRDAPCLRVLSLWNARTVSLETIANSWFVDSLSEQEMTASWSVFCHVATGVDLPASLGTRIGPPIMHPDDPRIEYQEEEVERAEFCLGTGVAKEYSNGKQDAQTFHFAMVPWCDEYEHAAACDLAAKSVLIFEAEAVFRVRGREVYLHVSPHSNWRQYVCLVADKSGEASDVLDGCRLVGKAGVSSEPVSKAQAVVNPDIVRGGFSLVDPAGKELVLSPLKEPR